MDNQLIRYYLDDLTATERVELEARLRVDEQLQSEWDQLEGLLNQLKAEHDTIEPPMGLAMATLSKIAGQIAQIQTTIPVKDSPDTLTPGSTFSKDLQVQVRTQEEEPSLPNRPPLAKSRDGAYFPNIWRRADLIVAASVGFLAFGLLITGVSKLRHENSIRVCQNNLREVHQALVGYSDLRGGQFPQVGTLNVPHAGDFDKELIRVGQSPPGTVYACPTTLNHQVSGFDKPSYAYTLGYRDAGGEVRGLTRSTPGDTTPIVADLAPAWNRGGHVGGQNVLFASGSVRFSSSPNVGYDGDNIYCNAEGVTRAGLNWTDTSLGHDDDRP